MASFSVFRRKDIKINPNPRLDLRLCYAENMKVILIHGKDTNPKDKWYPWFRQQMELKNIEIHIPELPNPGDPQLDEWLAVLEKLQPDENTILIGHSRGGVAVLRFLEKLPKDSKVKKVILVATNSGLLEDKAIQAESNQGFYTEQGFDFAEIKSHCSNFIVFHSKDDQWVPFSHGEKNAKNLNAKFITFENKGHFGKNNGIVDGLIEEIG